MKKNAQPRRPLNRNVNQKLELSESAPTVAAPITCIADSGQLA